MKLIVEFSESNFFKSGEELNLIYASSILERANKETVIKYVNSEYYGAYDKLYLDLVDDEKVLIHAKISLGESFYLHFELSTFLKEYLDNPQFISSEGNHAENVKKVEMFYKKFSSPIIFL